MNLAPTLTPAQRENIRAMHASGASPAYICSAFDISGRTLRRVVDTGEPERKPKPAPRLLPGPQPARGEKGTVEAVDAMLRNGAERQQVADDLGLSRNYVDWRAQLFNRSEGTLTTDSSSPKFAHNDEFCELVAAHGGMPVLVIGGKANGAWVTAEGRCWFRHNKRCMRRLEQAA
jgi:hypothetical protein